jgi:hypothetical protein
MRIMDPTPAKGTNPGYPTGYVKYENAVTPKNPKAQGVDPYSGRTVPPAQAHKPID